MFSHVLSEVGRRPRSRLSRRRPRSRLSGGVVKKAPRGQRNSDLPHQRVQVAGRRAAEASRRGATQGGRGGLSTRPQSRGPGLRAEGFPPSFSGRPESVSIVVRRPSPTPPILDPSESRNRIFCGKFLSSQSQSPAEGPRRDAGVGRTTSSGVGRR